MSYKIVIKSEDFHFVPNDSYLTNNSLTYSFVNYVGKHLNFFLPSISGLTETQKKMTINIFSVKLEKVSVFILSNKSNQMGNGQQVFADDTPQSNIEIKIKNGMWNVKTKRILINPIFLS